MSLDWKQIGTTLVIVVVGAAIAMFAYEKIKESQSSVEVETK